MNETSTHYDPRNVEDKWYARWEASGVFHGRPEQPGPSYCVVIPPPNVTGFLHMGHALNNTLQDVLVRVHRMRGYNVSWVPGTDHAGIATQNVVERALKKEGTNRHQVGREAFLEKVWAWKEQYGSRITMQLRRLGCSCDWERERFTMDEGLSNAVREVFVRLYDKGLIYRGNYIINWCPQCLTALSDEESEHEPTNGKMYHIRYPIQGGGKKDWIIVATTRPETLLGDVAVAVNPRDERYRGFTAKTIVLPLLNRALKVVEDDYVDPAFGTGVVKITPAHDPNDFEVARRHNLEAINVMNPDGTMNEAAGPYAGMDRFECRKKIIADLEALGLMEKIEDHAHGVGQCYRCHSVVEPRLSRQWFVKMKPLARPAIESVKQGHITFTPERWSKVYLEWMENIRDWCISRQIWWGHRIPVFYCGSCEHQWADRADPGSCPACGDTNFRQEDDVLDTWFSSWLWPFSVFGWPEKTASLERYYPTQTLSTASEILFFWVARMVMAGHEFMGDIPFSQVYIHGTVRDEIGRKMSKSLGNSIDPIEIIEKYSADALRWSLVMLTATGQDVQIADEKFELGRNFCTKLWNAARFMRMHGEDIPADFMHPSFDGALLSPDDHFILHRLQRTIVACNEHLERFRFNDYAKELYEFAWHQFCDWYVEYAKMPLNSGDPERKARVLAVMHHVYASLLRLLHPVIPFITEELWHTMGYHVASETIQTAAWPVAKDSDALRAWKIRRERVDYVEAKHEIIRAGRNLRADYNVAPSLKVAYILKPTNTKLTEVLESDRASLMALMRAESLTVDPAYAPTSAVPGSLTRMGTLYLPLTGLVDVAAEIERLNAQLLKMTDELERVSKKLENENFVSRAPTDVVDQQRARKKELIEKADKMRKLIASMREA